MVNVSLVNETSVVKEVGAGLNEFFRGIFIPRLLDIVKAPYVNKEMLWMAVPLVATMLLLMFYFSRYKEEELGWNTAVGNSLVLIFVGLDLVRRLYTTNAFTSISISALTANVELAVALFIVLEGMLLLVANFTHILPKRFAFFISSPVYINLTAYIGLVVVYSDVPIDLVTALSAVVLFMILSLLFWLINKITPDSAREIAEEVRLVEKGVVAEAKKDGKFIGDTVRNEEKLIKKRIDSRDKSGDGVVVVKNKGGKVKKEKEHTEQTGMLASLKKYKLSKR